MAISSQFPWGTSSGSIQSPGVYRVDRNSSTGAVVNTYTDNASYLLGSKTRSAVTHNLIANNWRPPSSANARITQSTSERGYYAKTNGILDNHFTEVGVAPSLTGVSLTALSSLLTQLGDASDTEALAKLRDQKMELGVSLVEAKKSFNHLSHTAIRLLEVYRNLRHGKLGAVAKELGLGSSRLATRNLANNWLEYSFAWLPLISDVHAAYTIAQEGLKPPLTMRSERNRQSSANISLSIWTDVPQSAGLVQTSLVAKPVEVQAGVKTILYTKISNSHIQKMGNLGLINPAEIAWELVPWSFVIDWFVPVGTFLSACTASVGQTFVGGTRTKWINLDTTLPCAEGSRSSMKVSFGRKVPNVKIQVFQYDRAALTSFPLPRIYGNRHLSTRKVVTAVALWRQVQKLR